MNFTPNALCFGSDLSAAGAPCRIAVSPAGVSIQFSDSVSELISFVDITTGIGGFDQDQLVLKWTRNGFVRTVHALDPRLIRSFRDSAPPELCDVLERTTRHVSRGNLTRRTVLGITVASAMALVLILWLRFDSLVDMAVDRVPVEWEHMIGDAAYQEILEGQTVLTNGAAVVAVQAIVRRLTDHIQNNPYRFQVTLARQETVNALALPGGSIVVFAGLLKQAETPEEVAGVLAHEISHVLLRHGLHGVVKNLGLLAMVNLFLGNQQGVAGLTQRLAVEFTRLSFSRQMETDADQAGFALLDQARVSPSGMIRFFERLAKSDTKQFAILSTHPMSATRAERLKSRATTFSTTTYAPIEGDWTAIKAGL